jgi:hypothetical protein
LNGNPQERRDPVFFLDRTHGKHTRNLLHRVDIRVVHHNDFFPQETKDSTWIERCGRENWIILTGDKEIERVPENRQAVIDAKCKVLFFDDTNSRGEEWAAAVIVGRKRLLEIVDRNNGPLFVTIQKYARSHISQVRFAGDGGPKPTEQAAAGPTPTSPDQPTPQPEREPQQKSFRFGGP